MGELCSHFLSFLSARTVFRIKKHSHVWSCGDLASVHDLYESWKPQSHVLLSDSCKVEGSESHLRTGFADRLGGDYSRGLAGLHESTLVILNGLQHRLVNSRLGQFRVYQALAQLVEYQGREGIVRLVDFILNVLLGRGSSLLHR